MKELTTRENFNIYFFYFSYRYSIFCHFIYQLFLQANVGAAANIGKW